MEILITIKNRKTRLSLMEGEEEQDFSEILEERSLSKKLLPEIDGLLRKNKLNSKDIREIQVKSDQNDNFTTTRIAKAVANAWSKV